MTKPLKMARKELGMPSPGTSYIQIKKHDFPLNNIDK